MKTLNEQVSRIKQMMGINEEDINLDSYKEEIKIIKDIEHVGTSEEGNPIIAITVNSFIGKTGSPEGQKIEIKVTTEWEKRDKLSRHPFMIKSIKDVVTNNENITGEDVLNNTYLRLIFMKYNNVNDVANGLYEPYLKLHSNDKEYREKIYHNKNIDEKLIMNTLLGNESQNVDDTPKEEPTIDNNKTGMWSSTSSWSSE